jgi:hypothetical protein
VVLQWCCTSVIQWCYSGVNSGVTVVSTVVLQWCDSAYPGPVGLQEGRQQIYSRQIADRGTADSRQRVASRQQTDRQTDRQQTDSAPGSSGSVGGLRPADLHQPHGQHSHLIVPVRVRVCVCVCGQQTADSRQQTADSRQQTAGSRQ